ncbi:hypothetical protein GCM10023080_070350 [Streptomyces pseudoechinosporeus]
MHTGGGALTGLTDAGHDNGSESYKENGDKGYGKEESWKGEYDKDSRKGEHDKPHGGVHTGGGGLAEPSVTAGGLAVLAAAGAGLYAARRRKTGANVA